MIRCLESEHSSDIETARPARLSRVQIVLRRSGRDHLYELVVDIDQSKVVSNHLHGKHSYVDSAYTNAVEEACRGDSRVQAQIDNLNLSDGAHVVIEAWTYATDRENDISKRTTMVW